MTLCLSLTQACTSKMNLSDEVDLEDYVGRPDKISNADIAAICQEVGPQQGGNCSRARVESCCNASAGACQLLRQDGW